MRIVALDFETANRSRESACALGVSVVEKGEIVESHSYLIRPPSKRFEFTFLHGIAWKDVSDAPPFAEIWQEVAALARGAKRFAAHNAAFDRSVLETCCDRAGLARPRTPFVCTMLLARRLWGIYPTRLPDVCARFRIPLDHHSALSDALACAQIVARAYREAGAAGLR